LYLVWSFSIITFAYLLDYLHTALGTGIGVSLLLGGEFYSGTKGLVEGGHMVSCLLAAVYLSVYLSVCLPACMLLYIDFIVVQS
jgi:hypothetical protein